MDAQKFPKVPLLPFFGTMRLTGDQKNIEKKFEKNSKKLDFFQFFLHAGTVEENT